MDSLHRHILEHQKTAVMLVDGSLCIRFMNQAAEALLAASDERSRGDHITTLLSDGDDFIPELQQALIQGQSFTKRIALLRAVVTAEEITVDYNATPMDDCATQGLLIELQPLDRVLRISREASQLTMQETTRELIRGLAHEIKNPLGGIRGAAQLLARELERPELSDYTDIIIAETDRLRNLVDRMLGPNQLPDFQPCNVHEVLERVNTLITAETDGALQIVRDYDPSIPEVVCDDEMILQTVLNIVRNATQALIDTAAPRITLRSRAVRQCTIGPIRHRLAVRLDVEDNGPGIPPRMRERLFYPMISGRADGSGLGLSIAQALIAQHGGLIECHSVPGCTRFTILLPMEPHHEAL